MLGLLRRRGTRVNMCTCTHRVSPRLCRGTPNSVRHTRIPWAISEVYRKHRNVSHKLLP